MSRLPYVLLLLCLSLWPICPFAEVPLTARIPSPPDLTIEEVWFNPSRARPEQRISISVRIANVGERWIKGIVEVRAVAKEGGWKATKLLNGLRGGEEAMVAFAYDVPKGASREVHFQLSLFSEEEPVALRRNNIKEAALIVLQPSTFRPLEGAAFHRGRTKGSWVLRGVNPQRVRATTEETLTFTIWLKLPQAEQLSEVKVSLVPSIPLQKRWFEIHPSSIKMGAGGEGIAHVTLTPLRGAPLGSYHLRVELSRKGRPHVVFKEGPQLLLCRAQPKVPLEKEAVRREIVTTFKAKGPQVRKIIERWKRTYRVQIKEVVELRSLGKILVLLRTEDKEAKELISELILDPVRPQVQPNYIYRSCGGTGDPLYPLQHGLKTMGVNRLHAKGLQGRGVRLALLDTGVDYLHEDLKGRILKGKDLIEGGPFRLDTHGTALAGIVVARCGNGRGICGVAPEAELLAVRVCRPVAKGRLAAMTTTFVLSQGLDYAVSQRVRAVNLSLGGPRDPLVEELVREAFRKGTVIVAAAGDRGLRSYPPYPAALPEVIAVAAVDPRGEAYSQGVRGDFIDLSAPGVDIISTSPGDGYGFFHGTSMAAAFVSGAVALLLQLHPELGPAEVLKALQRMARDLGQPGRDDQFGWGLVNLTSRDLVVEGENPKRHPGGGASLTFEPAGP